MSKTPKSDPFSDAENILKTREAHDEPVAQAMMSAFRAADNRAVGQSTVQTITLGAVILATLCLGLLGVYAATSISSQIRSAAASQAASVSEEYTKALAKQNDLLLAAQKANDRAEDAAKRAEDAAASIERSARDLAAAAAAASPKK